MIRLLQRSSVKVTFATITLFLFAQFSLAGEPQDNSAAIECFNRKDFKCSIKLFEQNAYHHKSHVAQFYSALQYQHGLGAERDIKKAIELYTLAADTGLLEAQNNLATIYESDKNGFADIGKAIHWYEIAAQRGDASSQFNLARLLIAPGNHYDRSSALHWFAQAAKQDDLQAQYNLGVLYLEGVPSKKEIKTALRWLRKSGNMGYVDSQLRLAEIFHKGQRVRVNIAEALDWYQRAAETSVFAQYQLGVIYETEGAVQSRTEALRWYKKAAVAGDGKAQYRLGRLLNDINATESERQRGNKWLLEACNNGVLHSCEEADWNRDVRPKKG